MHTEHFSATFLIYPISPQRVYSCQSTKNLLKILIHLNSPTTITMHCRRIPIPGPFLNLFPSDRSRSSTTISMQRETCWTIIKYCESIFLRQRCGNVEPATRMAIALGRLNCAERNGSAEARDPRHQAKVVTAPLYYHHNLRHRRQCRRLHHPKATHHVVPETTTGLVIN